MANNVCSSSGVPPLSNPLLTPLPPRYRLRDLILGDFAYADDGERFVFSIIDFFYLAFIAIAFT